MDQEPILITGDNISTAISSCWLARQGKRVVWLTSNISGAEKLLKDFLENENSETSGTARLVEFVNDAELLNKIYSVPVILIDEPADRMFQKLGLPIENSLLISRSWQQPSTGKFIPACFIFHSMLSFRSPLAEIHHQEPLDDSMEKKVSAIVYNWHKIPLIRTGVSMPIIPVFEFFLVAFCLQAVGERKVSAYEADFLISMLTGNREFQPLKLLDASDYQYFQNIQRQLNLTSAEIPAWLRSFSIQKPAQSFYRTEKNKITHSFDPHTNNYQKVSVESKGLRKFRSKFDLETFRSKKKSIPPYIEFINDFLHRYRELIQYFSEEKMDIFQLEDLLASGYHWQNNPLKQTLASPHGEEKLLSLKPLWPTSPYFSLQSTSLVWSNRKSRIQDLKDGVFNLEFRGKMNIMGPEVIEGIWKAIDIAETQGSGLVIANQGTHFSAGAHLGILFLHAVEQNYRQIEELVKRFQDTMLIVRDCTVPVVVAPHHLSLGGACEMSLHADAVVVLQETWMGLVEIKAGLLPGGGGTKALTVKAALAGDQNLLMQYFRQIITGKISDDAADLQKMALFNFEVAYHFPELLLLAKKTALNLSRSNPKPALPSKISLPGKALYQKMLEELEQLVKDPHHWKIGRMVAEIMSGGDQEGPIETTELELLKMERVAFTALTAEKETLIRMKDLVSGKRS